ncbi:chorismate synthase, chloroplastic-like [Aristolochia californica]|uniref:chorismate synthase, chloroplastic-like n=1 Tax=Aristolochia californica TaxID=171875 RepID=UPI0035D8AA27
MASSLLYPKLSTKGVRTNGGSGLGFPALGLRRFRLPTLVTVFFFSFVPSWIQVRAATRNSFGTLFRIPTYGESHGGGVGCVIDGCPPRVPLSEADIQFELDRRVPGQSKLTSTRNETDTCKILSGISEGITTGSPMHVFVPNTNPRDHNYTEMSTAYGPSHADATYDFIVTCLVKNVPLVWNSPVFDKLEAELAKACMSIPAIIGFEFGSGFAGTSLTGSQHNDEFCIHEKGRIRTRSNRSGGIQGGISNGETITMRIALKPTPTIAKKQRTVTRDRREIEFAVRGQHELCIGPRAVLVVEAMVALVLMDQLLLQYAQCELFPINQSLQEPLEKPSVEAPPLFF